LLKRQAA